MVPSSGITYPGCNQTLFRHSILDVEHFAGINHAHSSLAANHLIPYLVNDICLDKGLLLDQQVACLGQLIGIGAV